MSFNGKVKIEGLKEAVSAMENAFPKDPKTQQRLLNRTISAAARPTIMRAAKLLADQTDGSGALSDSIQPRAISRGKALARRVAASIEITPVRKSPRAIAKYVQFYYKAGTSMDVILFGLRHGHLVEFGFHHPNGEDVAARPFLAPAMSNHQAYVSRFAKILRRKIELEVNRRRKKGK